jgi:hypothetical protein
LAVHRVAAAAFEVNRIIGSGHGSLSGSLRVFAEMGGGPGERLRRQVEAVLPQPAQHVLVGRFHKR